MSDLDAFMTKVQQNIKLLSSQDAKTRRKAAAWLGEAGEPSAITRLKQVYEEDSDPGVRQAAAYSLGMFRALEHGMNSDDSDRVYDLLEDIALRGRMGRRVPVRTGCLARLLVGLVVSLAVMLVFNFVFWPQYQNQILSALGLEAANSGQPADADSGQPASPETAASDLSALLLAIRDDAARLQAQYNNPAALDCQAVFQNPVAYDFSGLADQPELTGIAARLNAQLVQLVTAKAPYNQACAAGQTALTAETVAVPLSTLETTLAELDAIETELAGLGS